MTDPTQDALHAERLARMIAMTGRVWPHRTLELRCAEVSVFDETAWEVVQDTGEDEDCCLRVVHDGRALDMVEAALLVGSGEGKVLTRQAFHEAVNLAAELIAERRRESMAELDAAFVPAWAEKLASEWEMVGLQVTQEARRKHAGNPELEEALELSSKLMLRCAAELRERAKGQP